MLIVVVIALWGLRNERASSQSGPSTTLQGTELDSTAAPDFTLTDQNGKTIELSQLHGKAVVLTFLYTHCPDVCPLIASKLHIVQRQLGKTSAQVMLVAVSIDPAGDTQASVQQFSQEHQLVNNWHYLLGTKEVLEPVWNAYSVYAQAATSKVTHSSAVYVIDKESRERVFFGEDFTTSDMVTDLQVLTKE